MDARTAPGARTARPAHVAVTATLAATANSAATAHTSRPSRAGRAAALAVSVALAAFGALSASPLHAHPDHDHDHAHEHIADAGAAAAAVAGGSAMAGESATAGETAAAVEPAIAAYPLGDSIPMEAQKVAEHVWFVQGQAAIGSKANANFISNAGFVVTPAGVVVVDALGSPAAARGLLKAIAKVTDKPVRWVLLTHYHADHVYGLRVFRDLGAQILAHEAGRDYLNSETASQRLVASRTEMAPWIGADTELVAANVWISAPTLLEVGGVEFRIEPAGPAHTPGDLTFYVPSEKMLFTGDIVFRRRIPYVGQADSRHWIAALERLLTVDASVIVPGHGPSSTDLRSDLQTTRDYLVFLRDSMGKAVADLQSFDEAYAQTDWSRFESLPLFKAANRMNAYNTYLLLEQEELKRGGG